MTVKFKKYDPNARNSNTKFKNNKPKFFDIHATEESAYRVIADLQTEEDTEESAGDFAAHYKIHWGYQSIHPTKPEWTEYKQFRCVRKTKRVDEKTVIIEKECPECKFIETKTAEYKLFSQELSDLEQKEDADPEQLEELAQKVETLNGLINGDGKHFKGSHQLDKKWYCRAKNLQGEWGLLRIGHKTKLAMYTLMKEMAAKNEGDPLSPQDGMWFTFKKNGLTGSDALTTVNVLTENVSVNGRTAKMPKLDSLTTVDLERIENLPSLDTLYPYLSVTQIQAMIDADGDPEVVAAAFNAPQRTTQRTLPPKTSNPGPGVSPAEVATATVEKPRPAPLAAEITVTPADDNVAMSEEQMRKHFAR